MSASAAAALNVARESGAYPLPGSTRMMLLRGTDVRRPAWFVMGGWVLGVMGAGASAQAEAEASAHRDCRIDQAVGLLALLLGVVMNS